MWFFDEEHFYCTSQRRAMFMKFSISKMSEKPSIGILDYVLSVHIIVRATAARSYKCLCEIRGYCGVRCNCEVHVIFSS